MGNKASNASGIESALSTFTSRGEDTENTYSRQSVSLSHRISPPFPKRHFTVVEKPNSSGSEAQLLQRANSASSLRPMGGVIQSSDDIGKHIVSTIPNDGARDVSLGTSIIIFLDKDIRTVNTNNIIKVTCDSSDSTSNPTTVQGQINYDPKQMKVEFIPKKTLFPNSKITVSLSGKAITSISCNTGANIVDTSFSFYTDTPPPKTVRIKLKEQPNVEQLQIANYYDLFNSLINWSSRKWGCSGEHVTGLFIENDGRLAPLKEDIDILNIKEDEIIIVEIKD